MTAALAYGAAFLVLLIGVLAAADIGIRFAARRADRAAGWLRPGYEIAIAGYLAGEAAPPRAVTASERAVLLQVATEALGDLQGSERDRLAGLLDRLGFVGDARAGLGSRRRVIRRGAAERLAVIGSRSALDALRPSLADRDVLVRCTAARLLAEAGEAEDEQTVRAAAAVAEQDVLRAPGATAAIVLALGQARPAAIGAMLGPDVTPLLRSIAIAVAGELRLASYGPQLQACLAERDDLAAAAAAGLGQMGEIMAVPALIALATEEGRSPAARTAAATALGSIGDAAAVPALDALLSAGDWSLGSAAAGALAELGQVGIAALRQAASSARPEIRGPARAALIS